MGDRSQYEPNRQQEEPTNNDKQDATTNAMRAVRQDTSDEIAGPPDIRTEDRYGLHLHAKQLET